jgi:C1A family cysteine protease
MHQPPKHRVINVIMKVSLLFIWAAFLTAIPAAYAQLSKDDIAQLQKRAVEEGWTFKISENPATQYPLDQLCGLKVPDNWQEMAPFNPFDEKRELPDSFDWRDVDGCTPVKNQGGCGSCWAFGTIGPLECNIKIKDGITVDLSEQWLVSCNSDGWDCSGGWFAHDYHQWKTDPCGGTGAVFESDFPYTATNGTCNCPYPHQYLITSWAYIGSPYGVPSANAIKQAIMDYGPVSVAVYANSAMQAYGGGIFNGCASGTVNHGVTLVGWDDNQGTNGVWFMRNSWGPGWGEDGGYMRIEYGCSQIGYGACYIDYPGTRDLLFEYPGGVPTNLAPGEPASFDVVVSGVSGGTPVPGTGQLHYSINDGLAETVDMTETSPNNYEATLPAVSCFDRIKFYVSAVEAVRGRLYDPDPASPRSAIAATYSVAVFEDNFESDKGWTVSGNATAGQWNRGVPLGGGDRGDPPTDFDGSGKCFLTDNADGDTDVDGGNTSLMSPLFDLSEGFSYIHYARWYSNYFGNAPYSDEMYVYISNNNGADWTLVETVGPVDQASGGWYEHGFWPSDFLTPGNQMRLRFDVSDLGDGSVVEAAVDDVIVTSYMCDMSQPTILTQTLPSWTEGLTYSQQLEAVGGVGQLIWQDKYNDLMGTGLTLSSSGLLSGLIVLPGPITFTAQVTDAASATDEKEFSFEINAHSEITTADIPDWTVGQFLFYTLLSTGGTAPIQWSDKLSDLDGTGMSLAADGDLSGTPGATGQITFTARIDDSVGDYDERQFSFIINPAVEIITESLTEGTEGDTYSVQLTSEGGSGEIFWKDKNSDLEGSGITLSGEGILSGIPAEIGTISFTARAEDITGSFDEVPFDLVVNASFICGDADGDETVNLLDITFIINYLYKGGPAPDPIASADVNGNGVVNILDATQLINYLYNSGPAPDCP